MYKYGLVVHGEAHEGVLSKGCSFRYIVLLNICSKVLRYETLDEHQLDYAIDSLVDVFRLVITSLGTRESIKSTIGK